VILAIILYGNYRTSRKRTYPPKRKGAYQNEPDQTTFLVNCDFSGRPYSRDEQRNRAE
jgi:hypothetical protein